MQEGVFLGFNPGDNSEAIRDVDCTYALRRRAKLRRLVIPKAHQESGRENTAPNSTRAYFACALGLAVSGAVFANAALAEGTAADAKAMLDQT
jgi:hypothetical protein